MSSRQGGCPVQSVHDLRFRAIPPHAPLAGLKAAIRAQMVATRCTQEELAARTGYSQKHISNVLSGKDIGSWPMIEKIANGVGLEVIVTVRPKP